METSESPVVPERHALYYPSIRIHDVNWLKATLLSFPQVRRIVPSKYDSPEDQELVQEYLETQGPRGPLLVNEDAQQPVSLDAQHRLMKKIKQDIGDFTKRFSETNTRKELGKACNRYRIHDKKFEYGVLADLKSHHLAWPAKEDSKSWWALHPTLGRAIMSTIAISIANSKGLDIVTDDVAVHRSICTQKDEDVFLELLGHDVPPVPQGLVAGEDELAHLVMTTHFDVSNLSVPQIVELQQGGSDLQKFKNKLTSIARTIPDVSDPVERRKRFDAAAKDVMAEWEKHKTSLVKKGFGAIFDATDTKLPEGAIAALSIAGGAAQFTLMATAIGAAIGLTTYAGLKMWRKYQESIDSPYNYLSKVVRAGGVLAVPTSIQVPEPGFMAKLKNAIFGKKKK
jgi:hypothetical protein